MKGGKLYGEGSNGIILGNPRLPCSVYEYPDDKVKSDEISKLPFSDFYNEVYKETTIKDIDKHFPNKTKLLRYFLLPEKECYTKPLNKEMRKFYTDEWLDNPHLKYDDDKELFIFQNNETNSIRQFVYKKADKTLEQILNNITTIKEAQNIIKKTLDLFNGLSYIHSKGFFHNDIKLDNIMSIKGNLKFVDNDQFMFINEVFDRVFEHNAKNLFYIGYSPILLFLNKYNTNDEKEAIFIMSLKRLMTNDNLLSLDTLTYCKHILFNFTKIFISINKSSLAKEQKNSMRIMLNRVLNHYMYGLLNHSKYYIENDDNERDINNKMTELYSVWVKIINFKISLFEENKDVEDAFDKHIEMFKVEVPEIEEIDKYCIRMSEKLKRPTSFIYSNEMISYMKYFAVSNDMCGFCFMLLQICEVLLNNEKYISLQPMLFDVFMMSCRLISISIEREVEHIDDFIRESGANIKRLLRVLEEDEEECRDGRCAIMGGKKTRRGKKKQRKTRRVRRKSRSRR